ncbi:MAG: uncharacterized protein JWM96_1110 [Alphaproteobacteria bacterium]|nr:uncharacterized protein [Alphaproteobacteria bacterium]
MSKPLMPKATAVWLVENTTLTFEQIALFCGLHALEVQAIADGDVAVGIVGKNPTVQGILTAEDIKECEENPQKTLSFVANDVPEVQRRSKGPRYTAVTKRADKPDGIAYLLKYYPDIPDAQIIKLLGTTKNTIDSIRKRTHLNITNIKPTDPVQLGLCTRSDLDALIQKVEAAKARAEARAEARTEEKRTRGEKSKAKGEGTGAQAGTDAEDTENTDETMPDNDVNRFDGNAMATNSGEAA